ncbi:MAG: tRNA (adenosine(37)-N6)-threonylcarbamoyltransferase complex dimerization subunit type 1 TsaB [Planctomycetes bacterium]|nr:tRNA (adenosine(37)-N6)-threonylcarbamoyltransferase complex dimerization subunit type 1 TsaB [Planctomycetota bacterium]
MIHALALETSHPIGSVVLRRGDGLIVRAELTERGGQARALAPAIRDLLRQAALTPRDLGLVVVGLGPGGYTGLRLGLATAKTLAVVLRIPILGVTSTSVLATAREVPAGPVLACVEATQEFVYGQAFDKRADGSLTTLCEPFIEPATVAAAMLRPNTAVVGSGARRIASCAADGARNRPAHAGLEDLMPRAEDLLNLGLSRHARGEADDERALLPLYLRPSEAERLWERRQAAAMPNDIGRAGSA